MATNNNISDLGSIYLVKTGYNGKNDYQLNEADVSKLDLITNAALGSTALCIDTGNIYVLMKSGWVLFGGGSNG